MKYPEAHAPRALAVAMEVARTDELEAHERRALLEEFDAWLGLELLTGEPSDVHWIDLVRFDDRSGAPGWSRSTGRATSAGKST